MNTFFNLFSYIRFGNIELIILLAGCYQRFKIIMYFPEHTTQYYKILGIGEIICFLLKLATTIHSFAIFSFKFITILIVELQEYRIFHSWK